MTILGLFRGQMLLVTGGAGFIGSNVIAALNEQKKYDIIVVDEHRKHPNLVGKNFYDFIDWREIIVNSPNVLNLPNIHGIIHLGAISDTTFADSKILMEQNYTFSKRILKEAEYHNCPIVYASSASVYGDGKTGFKEDQKNEDPKSLYAFSKWMFDQHIRRLIANEQINVPISGMRYFNVYGSGEEHKGEMRSFVHKCFTAISRKEKITLFYGSQDIFRDFIYISDVVDITLFLLQANKSGIFNIGTGVPTNFLDLAKLCIKITDTRTETCFVPFPERIMNNYQHHTRADVSKLREAGWKNQFVSLETGVKDYWEKFRAGNMLQ